MRSRVLGIVALVVAVIGLGASIASLVDYLAPQPTFCMESGCATVRASEWAHPLGIPMPVFGIVFFSCAIALSFIDRPRMRLVWSLGGAAVALALIGLQAFSIHAWCKLCLFADPSAVIYAIAVLAGAATLTPTWRASAIAPGVLLVVLGLGLWTHQEAPPPTPPPAVVLKEQKPGVVTIVEFVDFECPFCRALHGRLTAALAETGRPVRIVRKMVPIKDHPHAMPAAIAWCGAEAQGKGDAMADALIAADPDSLTPEGCEQIAARLGLDLAKYRAVCAAPATAARIARDTAAARAAGVKYLPTVYIGATAFSGAKATQQELVAALRGA